MNRFVHKLRICVLDHAVLSIKLDEICLNHSALQTELRPQTEFVSEQLQNLEVLATF